MAVVAISRQVAALGDEIAAALAQKINYTFIDRMQIEKRIVELGFPQDKLPRYDERKPNFFANLAKDRDDYLNYLQYAVLEAASTGNCILIGRGAFKILESVQNLVSLRFVTPDDIRRQRLKEEKNWTDKQAQARMDESDANRRGFHKSFFNMENETPQNFLLTLNTGLVGTADAVKILEAVIKTYITPQKEQDGKVRVERLLKAQRLVNQLLFDYKLNINFLRAEVDDEKDDVIVLHGVADSQALSMRAVETAAKIYPTCEIRSSISITQDFKTY